ncbi:hypothetical protein [Riemerella columbina]|uniref:hypothetical protein n=1 Tax=Riemerella columbina TaxID=103810 RepID=UPI00037F838C|nr:hypothetical protein [Riemerella columbina]
MSKLQSITIAASIAELAKAEAENIFKNYPELEEVYITSDMQGFKELEKAENQATYLKDKKVHHFNRTDLQPSVSVLEKTNEQDEDPADDNAPEDTDLDNAEDQADEDTKTEEDERAKLMAKYEQKHGKKAPHNIGMEKLRASVED